MLIFKRFFKDLSGRREYLLYSTKYELKVQLSRTYLGYVWWILDPLFYMLVYMLIVMVIFQRGEKDFPVFVFCALVPWKWTLKTIMDSINSIKSRTNILNQVYIPKPVIPFIKILTNTVYFFFGLVVLVILIRFFKIPVTFHYLESIIIFLVQFLFIFGLSLIFSHLGVFFKDIRNILAFTVRLWFYLSPGLYSLDRIPENIRFLWWINPLTTFFISYRNVFLYGESPLYLQLSIWTIVSILTIFLGLKLLYKYDKKYMKFV